MDSSTYFNVIVPKNISVTTLTYQIFKEHLAQTIVNKATCTKMPLGALLSLLLNNQNLPR